jgi:hypothetical protein
MKHITELPCAIRLLNTRFTNRRGIAFDIVKLWRQSLSVEFEDNEDIVKLSRMLTSERDTLP